jgi:hypothetical protein
LSSTALPTLHPPIRSQPVHEDEKRALRTPSTRVVVLLLVAISAAYVGWHLFRGLIPHDDGALAQSAERLMYGELPHRDFDDIYTGGLSYLNAAAFWLFGTSFASMRLPLFAVFLAWVPTVYYIASRFVRQYAAAAVTLLCVVWSLPNYTAPMPTWYNLFLATFGLAALFAHIADGRRRWLFAAGVAGGLSILVKVVGLYYVAAVLLFLVFRAHAVARAKAGPSAPSGRAYATAVTAALLVFLLVLVRTVWQQLHPPEAVQFVLPAALVALLLARQEWVRPAGDSSARFQSLARLLLPFAAGLVLPIALFLIPYVSSGSVPALVYGVFVLPMKRFGFASAKALPLPTMWACVPLAVAALLALRVRGRAATWLAVITAAIGATLLVLALSIPTVHRSVWYSARSLLPLAILTGVIVLSRERVSDRERPLLREQSVALLSATAVFNLVQFPFFVPIYFSYVAPLLILTTLALFAFIRPTPRALPAVVVGFYFLFAVVDVNTEGVFAVGRFYRPYATTKRLALLRGGLDVFPAQEEEYARLIPMLRARAHGGYTWASRDCPEVYFLAGLKNPTRTLFDFFDDTTDYTARTLKMLDERGVTAIVMNRTPAFSAQFTMEFANELFRRYPFGTDIGQFHVRWRS